MKTVILILALITTGCSEPIDLQFQDKLIGHWRKMENPHDTLSIIQDDRNKLFVKYEGLQFEAIADTTKQVLRLNAGADVVNFNVMSTADDKLNLSGEGDFERIEVLRNKKK